MKGYTRWDITQFSMKKWGVEQSSIDVMSAHASNLILQVNEESVQDDIATITSSYWDLYRRAISNASKDKTAFSLSLCVGILKEISKMKGLDDESPLRTKSNKRKLQDLSDETIDVLLVSKNE